MIEALIWVSVGLIGVGLIAVLAAILEKINGLDDLLMSWFDLEYPEEHDDEPKE